MRRPGHAIPVRTPDGVRVAAQVSGNPNGPGILFVHGFSQCHLAWDEQVHSSLADEFKLVTYDLRGHGGSDRPDDPGCYRDGARWAGELAAVIVAAGLDRPVVVAWSYAGRVVADYLAANGAAGLAGINFVAAATSNAAEHYVPQTRQMLVAMGSDDLQTNVDGAIAFVRACFADPIAEATLLPMLAWTMMVRPAIRRNLGGRPLEIGALLAGLDVPVLVSHGEADTIILPSLARYTATMVPGAALSLYPDCGHTPFREQPTRFNAELGSFRRSCR